MDTKERVRERLSRNLTALMADQDLKPEALAKRAGVGFRSLYRVIRKEQTASEEMLDKIARGLGVATWALSLDHGPKTKQRAADLERLVTLFQGLSPENQALAVNMLSALSGDNTLSAPYPKDKARNTAA